MQINFHFNSVVLKQQMYSLQLKNSTVINQLIIISLYTGLYIKFVILL